MAALVLTVRPAAAQPVIWTSGTFTYDGSGNITFTGADAYAYDALSRLTSATADRERTGAVNQQSYTYDSYGNRLTTTTSGIGCMGGCAPNVAVNAYNHLFDHSATYDEAGNLKTFDTFAYEYDGSRMLTRQTTPGGIDWQSIYTADDERVGTYTGQGNWRFTLRDLDGKVLREVTAWQGGGGTTWTRDRDHVYRDGLLLATVGVGGGTEHFHLDHLGTPRLVTNASGSTIGIHTYYPFGEELALNFNELPAENLKFTGHERDVNSINGNSLDYLHARYYSPTEGRFLSVDPEMDLKKTLPNPQMWNRYAYVVNNPINAIDPNGRDPWLIAPLTIRFGLLGPVDPAGRRNARMMIGIQVAALTAYLAPSLAKAAFTWALGNPTQVRQLAEAVLSPPGPSPSVGLPRVAHELASAERIGAALKADPGHRAASFGLEAVAQSGQAFSLKGGDGVVRTLIQAPGKLNGNKGIFEYIMNTAGQVTHQRFIENGVITGLPNQKPS